MGKNACPQTTARAVARKQLLPRWQAGLLDAQIPPAVCKIMTHVHNLLALPESELPNQLIRLKYNVVQACAGRPFKRGMAGGDQSQLNKLLCLFCWL